MKSPSWHRAARWRRRCSRTSWRGRCGSWTGRRAGHDLGPSERYAMNAPAPGISLMWLLDGIVSLPATDARVADLTLDSREARAGSLFFALCGLRSHGLKFAADAAARGAS